MSRGPYLLVAAAAGLLGACPGFGDRTLPPPPAVVPTYLDDIAPLVEEDPKHRCVECHSPDGWDDPGVPTSFRLDRCLDDGEVRGAAAMAERMVSLAVRGEPIWMPYGATSRQLDDDEAATLTAWAEGGAPCAQVYSHPARDGREVGLRAFFETYCVSCHGPEREDPDTPEDVLYDSCENILAWELPDEESLILQALRGELDEPMPPLDEAQPSPDELAAVERWIAARKHTDDGLPPCTQADLEYSAGEL